MAKTMTTVAVKSYRAGKERREIPDGGAPGLRLVIQPSGHKSWALRFRRPSGKSAKLTLGPVDFSGREAEAVPVVGQPLTLPQARRLAADIGHRRAMGRDVVAEHEADQRRRRSENETRAANTFAAAARDFIEQYASKKTRRWGETARLLGLDGLQPIRGGLCERWADKPVATIDGHDIHTLIEEVVRLGTPGLARKSEGPTESRGRAMFAALSAMFGWLAKHRRVERNPCDGVHKPDPAASRDRVLTDAEIVKFWRATDTVGEPFGAALKLLLLTGCRLNEVAGMSRAELSDDGTALNVPGSRTKNHRPHIVPLPPLAREILASVAGNAPLVFTTNGRTPVSGWSKIKTRLDAAMAIPPWRIHDLRRTAATGMAELGIAPHIVEAALNHISGAKAGVAGTYNRAAYAPEKKAALERWASHVAGIVSGQPGKVVPLHTRRK